MGKLVLPALSLKFCLLIIFLANPTLYADAAFGVSGTIDFELTRTDLVAKLLENPEGRGMLPRWLGMIPMGRMAEVEDLQGAVVYLASAASDYMTGHDLVVPGDEK
jgi:NAD(P)-dependent dehydrogenase (short-subunit alcohol dehydrogenase family)